MTAPARRTPSRRTAPADAADAIMATLPEAELNALAQALARLLISAAKNGYTPRRAAPKPKPLRAKKSAARG